MLFFLASCKTDLVYITVKNPAPVTISPSIRSVALINRAIPSEENKTLNTIHQVTTGQSKELIKEASAECIKGLKDQLIHYKKFDTIKTINDADLNTPSIGFFPSPLSWAEVEKIALKNDVDLLFVLELFDTDIKVVPLSAPPKINNPLDIINTVVNAQANITTTVKTGWRVYDVRNKRVLDQFPLTDNLTITANVTTIVNTTEAIMNRKEAIKQSSYNLGNYYVDRILPHYAKVTRDYYVKGNGNFKIAKRKAQTGNWESAGELWKKETLNSKRKIAGRAHYNMAILSEINGDLDAAIDWAQKSYENYNNKLGLQYVNNLRFRKKELERLQYQEGK